MKKSWILPKSEDPVELSLLSLEHLAQVLALQDETRQALPEGQKMFVLPQSADYFKGLLSGERGHMIGVRRHGALIAQMALMGPLTLEEAITKQAISRNVLTYHHADLSDHIVIAKSMTVHPTFRGNELSGVMLNYVLSLPSARSSDHMFAQVSADNIRSWDLFLRHDFGIVGAVMDPIDNKARFVLQKPVLGFGLRRAASAHDIDPAADFAAIARLTEHEGLIGCLSEGVAFKLAFYANIERAAVWDEPAQQLA